VEGDSTHVLPASVDTSTLQLLHAQYDPVRRRRWDPSWGSIASAETEKYSL